MRHLHYYLLDVFTDRPFGGNQLAVFTNGRGVSGERMQQIARELNLSETVFVLPPDDPVNDWRLRIFTPGREMLMAGHPTVGTAYLLAQENMVSGPVVTLEEGVGPITVTYDESGLIWMDQPMPAFDPPFEDREAIAAMLSLSLDDLDSRYPVQPVSSGVPFLYVPLVGLDAIRRAQVRLDVWESLRPRLAAQDIFVFTSETVTPTGTVHARMFAPSMGITEDPATGAASGPLGAYLVQHGIADGRGMVSEQGFEMGRPSLIHIEIERDGETFTRVRIGGQAVYIGEGALLLTGEEELR